MSREVGGEGAPPARTPEKEGACYWRALRVRARVRALDCTLGIQAAADEARRERRARKIKATPPLLPYPFPREERRRLVGGCL